MEHYLAIDIGGTYIKYGLFINEELTERQKTPTPVNDNQAIAKQIYAIVDNYDKQFVLHGIGISTAGIVDRNKCEIVYAGPTIKDYKGTNFKKILANFDLPVYVTNDVDAALLGEHWHGAVKDCDHVYCITLGTGIGGAMYEHELVDGAHYQAHSVGYLLYDPETKTNFEMRASTSALNAQIERKLGSEWTTKQVFEQAKAGHSTCLAIIHDWTQEIAAGLAQIILINDPEVLVIGGGVSAQGVFLLENIKTQLQHFLPADFLKTELKIATLQNDAALFGAVYPLIEIKGEI